MTPRLRVARIAACCGLLASALAGCSSYDRIATLRAQEIRSPGKSAKELLEACSLAHFPNGMPASVTVALRGEWSVIAHALQPELCDRHWRGPSWQHYDLVAGTTHQRYDNEKGIKEVFWNHQTRSIAVTRAGEADTSASARQCGALVADAYPFFIAGAGLALEKGLHPIRVGQAKAGSAEEGEEMCDLVALELKPGFGLSDGDDLVLWIGQGTRRLRKMQMTLRGFPPTRTAEVALVFGAFKRDDQGCLWPTESEERLYRPAPIMVYRWKTTVLSTTPRKP